MSTCPLHYGYKSFLTYLAEGRTTAFFSKFEVFFYFSTVEQLSFIEQTLTFKPICH